MMHGAPDSSSVTGVLVSGGLDSCILLAHLLAEGRRVQPFYIRTGVTWEHWELAAVQRFIEAVASPRMSKLVTLDLPLRDVYGLHWSLTGEAVPNARSPDEAVFLPGRNALLLIKAAVWCQLYGISELALAPLGTSPFADATNAFAARFEEVINFGAPRPIRILLPFAATTKGGVMELGKQFPLQHTFSCIAPIDGQHCGNCNKCAERRLAFARAGTPDPTCYRQPII